MDYNPWGRKELDTTERLTHIHMFNPHESRYTLCLNAKMTAVALNRISINVCFLLCSHLLLAHLLEAEN